MKKKITIRDLANEAGVSVTTVSQILNNKGERFSKATQEKVFALRDKYKYVPDFNARNLILKSAKTIGVLVPNIANPFFGTFVEGVQSIAREAKFIPLVFSANKDPKLEKYYLSQMIERSISGLVIASATMTTATIKEVISFNDIPYILFDQNHTQDGDRVQTSDYLGGQIAAKHLLKLGHKKIAVLTSDNPTENLNHRMNGFKKVIEKSGLTIIDSHDIIRAPLTKAGGYTAAKEVLATGASAVFAANDEMAIGLLRGLHERGIKVPEEMSVMGYDNIYWDDYVYPRLTTVQQPIFDLGAGATKMLIERINHDSDEARVQSFPVKLIERDSTGPYQQK
ncbi:LacI family DNA-binding transcriptional regulator [Limosilactobacillus sp. STM2_1]|uniref:LacI family DNA-binding transcriptional regulator n=1 Tax=Limosilactobacillus rudii TaxID=2759755 RepID=A0A7W3YLV8_9LACO|nr:LacI family DNA-binding transcriptional regulator [Limosilactobacillus rudii]MBB1080059.1 LacI family DNA-binding transcriptional regulator [Limosilactobacillus rudii]MBB1096453.1 LacI family DNA-binding transcriptional regulator [Limosilactobacillus rudii]MCD7133546.1 LacI family transcriptional regulator [Limosilactobacillus rudii]